MKTAGIVAEYNPFHFGHEYHIRRTKELLGDCGVICVMSGDFVQRGEHALFSKYARAEAACRSGADLVIELPVLWALSSAERFAAGAVGLLNDLGTDFLSFGSEAGVTEPLFEAAEKLLSKEFGVVLRDVMDFSPELSFAAAREKAFRKLVGFDTDILRGANNNLAIEYIKTLMNLKSPMKPVTIQRVGSGHDEKGESEILSASDIRERFRAGESIEKLVPGTCAKVYINEISAGRIIYEELFEAAAMSRLRMFDAEYFNSIPDAKEGLGDRLFKAVRSAAGFEEVLQLAKTKKFAMSRIRRACMCACLGIREGDNAYKVPYARVLAANSTGCRILREKAENIHLPIITRPAEIKKQDERCRKVFAVGEYASDMLSLCYENKSERKTGSEWLKSPFIVKNE